MCLFCSEYLPVTGIFSARAVHVDNNKDMLEVRANILWSERQSSWLLKDYGDNVVPYVSLSQELRERRKIYKLDISLSVTTELNQRPKNREQVNY